MAMRSFPLLALLTLQGAAPSALHAAESGGKSPTLLPGDAPNSSAFETIPTAYAGAPSAFNYKLPVIARWAAPDLIEVGRPGARGSRQFGLLAFHQPDDKGFKEGKDDDVCQVDVRADGGPWVTITGPTWNDSDKETDWNFTVNNTDFPDGLHRVDAIVKPCSGPSLVMEGPLEYSATDHTNYVSTEARTGAGIVISDGSGKAPGNVMTVLVGSRDGNHWRPGWEVTAIGVEPNTRVVATAAEDTSLTGKGGAGTYRISGPPQLLTALTPAVGAIHRSYYFLTNYHGSLHRYVEYVRPPAKGGNDANPGDSPGSAKANIGAAVVRLMQRDTVTHADYGGTVCLMDSGTFHANGTPQGSRPKSPYGWIDIVKAESDPHCGISGSGPDPVILTDSQTNTSAGGFAERWAHVTIKGPGLNNYRALWVDYVLGKGPGVNWRHNGRQEGLLVYGASACTNSVVIGYFSGCRGTIVRNTTMQFIPEDFFHGASIIVGNKLSDGGDELVRIKGSTKAGSNIVTNVTVPPGFAIGDLLSSDAPNPMGMDVGGCYATYTQFISAIDETARTLTMSDIATRAPANAKCSVSDGDMTAWGVHSDFIQFQSGQAFADIIILNNDGSDANNAGEQGLFAENPVNGLVYKNNKFHTQHGVQFYIQVSDGQYGWIMSNNTWEETGSSTSGFNLRGPGMKYWLDMNNQCVGSTVKGGKKGYRPAGTNIRVSGGSCH